MTARKTHKEFIDEVYNLVGDEYTVLGTYQNIATPILMKHNECGNEYYVRPSKFLIGQRCPKEKNQRLSKSKTKSHAQFIKDLRHRRGNEFELLEKYKGNDAKTRFKHNVCGQEVEVTPNNILSGSGCPYCYGHKNTDLFKARVNEVHNGEYVVLGDYKNNRTKILVKHSECGHEWEPIPKDLLNGHGCPRCKVSLGEKAVKTYLIESNVNFKEQYWFDDCRNILPLPFDFAILDGKELKCLIEFDGIQHYSPREAFGGEVAFKKLKRHDEIKNNYCVKNKIKLIRIPYWHLKNISKILDKALA